MEQSLTQHFAPAVALGVFWISLKRRDSRASHVTSDDGGLVRRNVRNIFLKILCRLIYILLFNNLETLPSFTEQVLQSPELSFQSDKYAQ